MTTSTQVRPITAAQKARLMAMAERGMTEANVVATTRSVVGGV